MIPENVIGKLRDGVASLTFWRKANGSKDIVGPRDEVLSRFQPVFSPNHIGSITEDELRSFLLFDNNHHWTGLHRLGPRICADMRRLREALAILVDESKPVQDRLDSVIDMRIGIGKNIATGILLILHPDRYGVWNNRSEATMRRLEIWPEFDRGDSFGERYAKVNEVLTHVRDTLQIDLWTLDALWWYLDLADSHELAEATSAALYAERAGSPSDDITQSEPCFGLERHLHEFLRDNWEQTELGREWALYARPGDDEPGSEYPCDVGRIDILAKHRRERRWLVIELKRNQTGDQTLGQLLRYMGWVKQHLALDVEQVQGMIICREADDALRYALCTVENVSLRFYQVDFRLKVPGGV